MKFAKELERDLVPEWRVKYLDYKSGKKHIKAISRAISRADSTPSSVLTRRTDHPRPGTSPFGTPSPPSRNNGGLRGESVAEDGDPLRTSPAPMGQSPSRFGAVPQRGERQRLTEGADADVHYGSIVPTPAEPQDDPFLAHRASLLELPGPAMRVPSNNTMINQGARPSNNRISSAASLGRHPLQRTVSMADSHRESHDGRHQGPDSLALPPGATFPSLAPSDIHSPRARLRRMFTLTGASAERRKSRGEFDLRALDEVREKEREFAEFLDSELDKVEAFYRQKEDSAGKRLTLLREQLHEMRNRRTSEIAEAKRRKRNGETNGQHAKEDDQTNGAHIPLLNPLRAKLFRPGPNSEAMQHMGTPVHVKQGNDGGRDYSRRPPEDEVPYRTAKRKLKLALQEFYRGLELLKSYAFLNRTAFRKLNKKYDKTVHARPPYRYMTEKVNKSWFVNSDVLDGHLQAVEDLYARYFERGNHKIAAGKLRSLSKKKRDESGSAFQNGIFIGIGAVFAIQGLVYGAELLFDKDPEVRTQTSYLLQIYGGYFLMLYLFSLFCLDCKLWTANRVNYPFIFEFDARSQLDWRQLAEFPSFFLFLLGLFMWLNFTRYGSPDMYLYYPVFGIDSSLLTGMRYDADISQWRLFFAGLYPVEFRDFFLGDMYCSLTYAMCNIELFFCLYANEWDNPQQCNSNHSRLLGFFVCLPPIWRFLQCIRRYKDTRNIFPHLVNCGKYTASILAGVFLSVYRIQNSHKNLALFVVFATINGFYTAFWDIFMDFSLLQPHTQHRFLRDITALKFRWPYYLIMILDPILRFNWVFYVIFTHDTQHSSTASFLIGFSEVTRRGMWTLLRVENEHCANVKQYRASRDVPLPYDLDVPADYLTSGRDSLDSGGKQAQRPEIADELVRSPSAARVSWSGAVARTPSRRATDIEPPQTPGGPSDTAEEGRTPGGDSPNIRRRRRAETVGNKSIRGILADAHRQDFEKKRRPDSKSGAVQLDGPREDDEEDDDESDDDAVPSGGASDEETGSLLDERTEIREAEMLARQGKDGDMD
ncbi:hypothetical protein M406DRAFT_105558 [Cryphonectria parasitica EP155]|uniref:Uncharacterized protein n=1 Tax=Cryphonectria parasitica (strain ATCC 38755 / EP155) TaxID=660469 RepID=A0A9P4YD66_CRYP1|nr:uncharacterized protein M406DRAFT_105558 [Cryphonectria parasitica EP155]KAF3770918.1 hypothetical protein M406DRAFT_105558 [Cryphonectria parasitica EP155]